MKATIQALVNSLRTMGWKWTLYEGFIWPLQQRIEEWRDPEFRRRQR